MIPSNFTRRLAGVFAGSVLILSAGCMSVPATDLPRTGQASGPSNFSGDASLGGIRRVVVLPLWVGPGTSPESIAVFDPVFLTALQQEKRFEVIPLSREECRRRFGAEAMSSAANLPADLFETVEREFAADAVLFLDVTAYDPYQPITLGLRGKLASIDGKRLIWTFDNVFSSEAPARVHGARVPFLDRDTSVPSDVSRQSVQSPSKFAAHAAGAMFATLPPVTAVTTKVSK